MKECKRDNGNGNDNSARTQQHLCLLRHLGDKEKNRGEIDKENYLDRQEPEQQLPESALRHYPNKSNGWETYACKANGSFRNEKGVRDIKDNILRLYFYEPIDLEIFKMPWSN